MSKAATLAVSLSVVGDGANAVWAPVVPITNAASPGGSQPVALVDGTTVVPVPTGAVGFVYVPPVGSVIQKTFRMVNGDTGGAMAVAGPTPYDWEGATAPPTNLYFGSTASEPGTIYWV